MELKTDHWLSEYSARRIPSLSPKNAETHSYTSSFMFEIMSRDEYLWNMLPQVPPRSPSYRRVWSCYENTATVANFKLRPQELIFNCKRPFPQIYGLRSRCWPCVMEILSWQAVEVVLALNTISKQFQTHISHQHSVVWIKATFDGFLPSK